MQKKDQWNGGSWLVATLLLMLQGYWQAASAVAPVPYSEFEKALAQGRVAEVLVADRTVTGKLKSPDSQGKTTIVATRVEPDLAERLSKYEVPFTRVVESTGLRDILKVHVEKVTLARDVDLEQVAALTTGFSGADLANLVNEAAPAATRRLAQEVEAVEAVEAADFTAAIERIVAGLEKKSRVLNPKERKTVAYHDGRTAEKLVFGELSTGAADDLARATDIARDMT